MKTGYPFLKISQKYNVDYATVLMAADYMKNHKGVIRNPLGIKQLGDLQVEVLKDIDTVNAEFAGMQAGFIQWQGGHEISLAA